MHIWYRCEETRWDLHQMVGMAVVGCLLVMAAVK